MQDPLILVAEAESESESEAEAEAQPGTPNDGKYDVARGAAWMIVHRSIQVIECTVNLMILCEFLPTGRVAMQILPQKESSGVMNHQCQTAVSYHTGIRRACPL